MQIKDFQYEPGDKWNLGWLKFKARTSHGVLAWSEEIPGPRHGPDSATVTVSLDGKDVSELFYDLDFEAPNKAGRWAEEFRKNSQIEERLSAYLEEIKRDLTALN